MGKYQNRQIDRDLSFDFIKGVLIFLVVYGHTVPQLSNVGFNDRIDTVLIYTFHMPLFIFVSGYFASRGIDRPLYQCSEKVLHRLFLPAFLWTVVNFLVFHLGDDCGWARKMVSSFRSVWYLYCMSYMYIVGCLIAKSKFFYYLVGGIFAIGYILYPLPAVGYVDYFQIIRQWPLFMMGVWYFRNKNKITPPNTRIVVFLSVVIYMAIIIYMLDYFPLNYILSKQNYVLRAVLYQTGAVMVFALLTTLYTVVKETHIASVFILLGQNTLGIYVMNEIMIKLFKQHCSFVGTVPLWLLSFLFTFALLLITLLLKRNKYTAKYLLGEIK